MTIATGFQLLEPEISAICRSGARGEMRPDSDVGVLVAFLPGARPGLPELSEMIREFAVSLGRTVGAAVKPARSHSSGPVCRLRHG